MSENDEEFEGFEISVRKTDGITTVERDNRRCVMNVKVAVV